MPDAALIDSHAHIFTTDLPMVDNPRHHPTYAYTAEDYIADLDAHGVSCAVLAGVSLYGDYNDYQIGACRKHPDRLRTTVILKPEVERYTMERMAEDGVVGMRLMWMGVKDLPDLSTFEYRRLLTRIRDLDWHVHLHLEGHRSKPVVDYLAAFGVKLVIDHFGTPSAEKGIACEGFQNVIRTMENGRTWVKMSAAYRIGRERADAAAAELLRTAPHDRLLWASDAPFVSFESTTYQDTIDDLNRWVPDPVLRRKIGRDNPLGLYFGGKAPQRSTVIW
jgi:predicted TIM-barrel fold metal-dependent hydrolase